MQAGQAATILAAMFARRFRVEVVIGDERRPCPLEWLDSFAMRNFTGEAEFDDTLPVGEGLLEAGYRVNPQRLAEALGQWLTRRGKGGGQPVRVELEELPRLPAKREAPPAADRSG